MSGGQTLNLSNRDLFIFVSTPFPGNSPQKGQHGFQIVHFRLSGGEKRVVLRKLFSFIQGNNFCFN